MGTISAVEGVIRALDHVAVKLNETGGTGRSHENEDYLMGKCHLPHTGVSSGFDARWREIFNCGDWAG